MIYLRLQIKRIFKILPGIIIAALCLAGTLLLLTYIQYQNSNITNGSEKINLGIVGNRNDSYLGVGISALQNLDSSRYTCSFIELTENEAKVLLQKEIIDAYFVIPDNFVDSIENGINKPVTVVFGNTQGGIGTMLVKELGDSVSSIITESQTGMYTMQHFYLNNNIKNNYYKDIDKLNLIYIDNILNRSQIYDINALGNDDDDVSIPGYYFCSVLILFILLSGISCCSLFIKNDMSLYSLLAVSQKKAACQVLSEYAAYGIFQLLNLTIIMLLLLVATNNSSYLYITELTNSTLPQYLITCIKIIPVLLVCASMTMLVFEIVNNLISGVLVNFIGTIVLAFLSGFFYSTAFFPESVQKFSDNLPTTHMLIYLEHNLINSVTTTDLCLMIIYTVLILSLCILLRKRKLNR